VSSPIEDEVLTGREPRKAQRLAKLAHDVGRKAADGAEYLNAAGRGTLGARANEAGRK
jgi:hypothetical protein